jgi:YHS domain-containing protein
MDLRVTISVTCNRCCHRSNSSIRCIALARDLLTGLDVTKLLAAIFLPILFIACTREASAPSQTQSPQSTVAALPSGWSRVSDPSQVCMVNDQFMGRAQIPVVVDGRTYFGCCPACKEKLENQSEMRTGRDPVTGQQVDKAKAVIVQDASGKVLYFESEETLKRYPG